MDDFPKDKPEKDPSDSPLGGHLESDAAHTEPEQGSAQEQAGTVDDNNTIELPLSRASQRQEQVEDDHASDDDEMSSSEDGIVMPSRSPEGEQKNRRHIERARMRQQAFLKKRREHKKLRVLYGRVKFVVKLLFAAALVYGLYLFATASFWMIDSPRFVVNNLRLLSEADVAPVVEVYDHQPIYRIDPRQIETILKSRYPVLDQVYVRRYLFPARLVLTLVEKHPWAEVYQTPHSTTPYAIVASDYVPIYLKSYERARLFHPDQKLARLVMAAGPRSDVSLPSASFFHQVDQLYYQLRQIEGLNLSYVDASRPDDVDIYFQEIRVRIGRLDATTTERLERLIPLTPQIQRYGQEIDWVDLRWLNQVTFHRNPQYKGPSKIKVDIH